jgi:hypothetical protein
MYGAVAMYVLKLCATNPGVTWSHFYACNQTQLNKP